MAFYMTALGISLSRDGWRFAPSPRGNVHDSAAAVQVLPTSQVLTYEVFVDELAFGPEPTLYADTSLPPSMDWKAFHCRRLGLRLTPKAMAAR